MTASQPSGVPPTESPIAIEALRTVSRVLGAPSIRSPKKVWRWEFGGLCVNVHRESRKSATIWLAGGGITSNALVVLDERVSFAPGTPPKNSNCSAAVKAGPTWFAYPAADQEFNALAQLLSDLVEGNIMVDEQSELSAEFDVGIEDGDAPLELGAIERRLATDSLDLSIESLVD